MAGRSVETAPLAMDSPFILPESTQKSFEECPTLCAVRSYLSQDSTNSFCRMHSSLLPRTQSTWLLHRDVLHALIVPVVTLYHRTARLAEAALCSSRPEDFEIAYRGDARSAFLTLQCFVHDEGEWCYSRGCPACTAHHALESESTIRLAITAALLAESNDIDGQREAASLADFLPALQKATEEDPFWGPSFWEHHYEKASALHVSIQLLIQQASELEVLVLSPRRGRSPVHSPDRSPLKSKTLNLELRSPTSTSPLSSRGNIITNGEQKSLPGLKASPLAKHQAKLDQEQRALLSHAAWQMYSAVAAPAVEQMAQRKRVRRYGQVEEIERRGRSLTN